VELHGEVVIGDNVIIDRQARLENTVVLPHSYVGELVELTNAIVRGNDLIRVDNGSIMKISDTFLLADLNAAPLSQSFGRLYNQVAGVLVLLLSTPLWLLAAGLVAVQNPAKPFISTRLRGNKIALDDFGQPNRAEFNAWECNVSAPVLRFLPRLLAVISGDLRLVGGLPVSCEQAQSGTEDWEKFAYQTWSGLIGPTQLTIPKDAPVEEKLMSDSFYRASYSLTQDFYYLLQGLRALLSRRAWL
jgi:lipopolysaccharide/colanic/teichoic acid biosynthesis glycosyltransferase